MIRNDCPRPVVSNFLGHASFSERIFLSMYHQYILEVINKFLIYANVLMFVFKFKKMSDFCVSILR